MRVTCLQKFQTRTRHGRAYRGGANEVKGWAEGCEVLQAGAWPAACTPL